MKKIIFVISLFILSQNLYPLPFSDIPSQTTPFGSTSRSVFGDFNLDGTLDTIQIQNRADICWGVYMNNSKGTYQINGFFGFMSGQSANAVAAGDMNNDGFMDIAVNIVGQSLMVVRNNQGGFDPNSPVWSLPDTAGTIKDVLFADFNNDGNLDLAVACSNDRNRIYQGFGNGTFSLVFTFPKTNTTLQLAAADLNKDNFIDLVTVNRSRSNIVYFMNGFTINSSITDKQPYYSTCAEIGDVNHDNWLDIIFGKSLSVNSWTNLIIVCTNNHTGSFAPYQTLAYTNNNRNRTIPRNISFGDIDNDKDIDMAVSYAKDNDCYVYIYTNNGSYFSKSSFNANDQQTRGQIDFVDTDNDGDLDLFASFIYENKSPLIKTTPAMHTEGETEHVLIFGDEQLLLQNWDKIILGRPYKSGGGGGWKWADWGNYTNRDHNNITAVAVGDINGVLSFNDKTDFIIGTRQGWIYAYTNSTPPSSSTNRFNLCWSNKARPGYKIEALALGDLNGDGAPDLLYSPGLTNGGGGNDTNSGCFIMFNNNGGFNTTERHLPPMEFAGGYIYLSAKEILVDDIDKDGDNDIIMGGGGPDLIYYNEGKGVFNEATSCYPEIDETQAIDLGDLDNDGDLDLIRGNQMNFTYAYRNNNGILANSPYWQSPTVNNINQVKLFDVDHDGDLDLACVNQKNFYTYIMKNKGAGLGTTQDDYLWKSGRLDVNYTSIIMKDYDGDNDTDLFLTSSSGSGVASNETYEGLYSDNFQNWTNLPNTATFIRQNWTNQGPGGAPADLSDVAFNIIAQDNEGRGNVKDVLVRFQISLLDGTEWKNATISATGPDMTPGPLPSSFFMKARPWGCTNRMLHWNAIADQVQGSRFIMRMIAYPGFQKTGKVQHAAFVYYMYGGFYINGGATAIIKAPKNNEKVSGMVKIFGGAYDYDFNRYVIKIQNSSGVTAVNTTNTNAVPPIGLLYEWNASSLPSGNYTITLSVFDNLYTSPVVDTANVRISSKEQDSPTITAVYPTNNMPNAAANSPVVVKFSRYMNENTLRDGTMRVDDGTSPLDGNVKYKSIVKCLIFDPDPHLSFNRTHIGKIEAAFQDVLGNSLGNDYIWNFAAEKGLPESIQAVSPLYEDVATNTPLKITYSLDMSAYSNFNDTTFILQDIDGNRVHCTNSGFNPSNRQIVFTPVAGLKGSTLYIATIQKGIIAEAVPYPYSWYFITQDMVQP
ncbi:MAG: FG-GAP-like repeat-containing protein, partial [bacterium]|nr:FG-GAP-like repeat-containing protein [bacterium]